MAHSFSSNLMHCVFSTQERQKTISRDLRERLWPYMGGIARENKMKAMAVGGTDDHAHLLLSLPATLSVSKAVQLIKGGSSKWIHDNFRTHRGFAWQEGYGAFSIGISGKNRTIEYIENQEAHHGTKSFEEEFISFLKKHGIEYDERYVWG